jgi:hypothetical protein
MTRILLLIVLMLPVVASGSECSYLIWANELNWQCACPGGPLFDCTVLAGDGCEWYITLWIDSTHTGCYAVCEYYVPGVVCDEIFSDGFETGDTGRWSRSIP